MIGERQRQVSMQGSSVVPHPAHPSSTFGQKPTSLPISRRSALASGAAFALGVATGHSSFAGNSDDSPTVCAFVKFLQSLSPPRLAETIAELGFDGIEATVRRGGQVSPEQVEDQLPALVEACRVHGIEITVMASDVTRADDALAQRVLRTAAKLGVRRYRMGYYKYDLSKDIPAQLAKWRAQLTELAALNRELGMTAVYQNHSGPTYVGAPLWDLDQLLEDIPPEEIGVAYDVRHAKVEAGLSWPVAFHLLRPHFAAVYVKDFVWDDDARRPRNVPLGEGRVDARVFELIRQTAWSGPISLHVEYLPKAGVEENIAALRRDLATLRKLLRS